MNLFPFGLRVELLCQLSGCDLLNSARFFSRPKMIRMKFLLLPLLFVGQAACTWLNEDIQNDLSKDPKTCINGVRYLPYTNGTDEAFTSEGKVINCKPKSP